MNMSVRNMIVGKVEKVAVAVIIVGIGLFPVSGLASHNQAQQNDSGGSHIGAALTEEDQIVIAMLEQEDDQITMAMRAQEEQAGRSSVSTASRFDGSKDDFFAEAGYSKKDIQAAFQRATEKSVKGNNIVSSSAKKLGRSAENTIIQEYWGIADEGAIELHEAIREYPNDELDKSIEKRAETIFTSLKEKINWGRVKSILEDERIEIRHTEDGSQVLANSEEETPDGYKRKINAISERKGESFKITFGYIFSLPGMNEMNCDVAAAQVLLLFGPPNSQENRLEAQHKRRNDLFDAKNVTIEVKDIINEITLYAMMRYKPKSVTDENILMGTPIGSAVNNFVLALNQWFEDAEKSQGRCLEHLSIKQCQGIRDLEEYEFKLQVTTEKMLQIGRLVASHADPEFDQEILRRSKDVPKSLAGPIFWDQVDHDQLCSSSNTHPDGIIELTFSGCLDSKKVADGQVLLLYGLPNLQFPRTEFQKTCLDELLQAEMLTITVDGITNRHSVLALLRFREDDNSILMGTPTAYAVNFFILALNQWLRDAGVHDDTDALELVKINDDSDHTGSVFKLKFGTVVVREQNVDYADMSTKLFPKVKVLKDNGFIILDYHQKLHDLVTRVESQKCIVQDYTHIHAALAVCRGDSDCDGAFELFWQWYLDGQVPADHVEKLEDVPTSELPENQIDVKNHWQCGGIVVFQKKDLDKRSVGTICNLPVNEICEQCGVQYDKEQVVHKCFFEVEKMLLQELDAEAEWVNVEDVQRDPQVAKYMNILQKIQSGASATYMQRLLLDNEPSCRVEYKPDNFDDFDVPSEWQNKFDVFHYALGLDRTDICKLLLAWRIDCGKLGVVMGRKGIVHKQPLICEKHRKYLKKTDALYVLGQHAVKRIVFSFLGIPRLVDVNVQEPNYDGPLHFAIGKGNTEIVRMLMKSDGSNFKEKLDVNLCDKKGTCAFFKAIDGYHVEIVRLLLHSDSQNQKHKLHFDLSNEFWTPERKAIFSYCGGITHPDVNLQGRSGESALHIFCAKGKTEFVRYLLANDGKNFKEQLDVNIQTQDGKSALHSAVDGGHTHIVQLLLDSDGKKFKEKLDVNIQNKGGSPALHRAVTKAKKEIVELFLKSDGKNFKKKLDVNIQDKNKCSVFLKAVRYGRVEIVKLFLESDGKNFKEKLDVNIQDKNKYTVFLEAVKQGKVEIVKLFLESDGKNFKEKFDINVADGNRYSILHVAVHQTNTEIVKLLLQNNGENFKEKLDVNLCDGKGNCVLHVAVKENNDEYRKLILENGEYRFLSNSSSDEFKEIVKLLLQNNGENFKEKLDVNLPDRFGKSPLRVARSQKKGDIVKLFLESDDNNFKEELVRLEDEDNKCSIQ